MNGRKAGALALTIVAWALRLCGIALVVIVVALSFSGVASRLGLVNLVIDISRAIPSVIAGYGLIATPMGGVFRLDFALMAVLFFLLDYLCLRVARSLRR